MNNSTVASKNVSTSRSDIGSDKLEFSEFSGILPCFLPQAVQDVLKIRDTWEGTCAAQASDVPTTGATVFQIMKLHTQITRLARDVFRADTPHDFDRDQLEDSAEDLAQEYIRFMLLRGMEYVIPFGTRESTLSPPPLINQLWALHVMETRSYANMCEYLVPGGCMIHYSRQRQPTAEILAARIVHTAGTYLRTFGCLPSVKVWPHLLGGLQAHQSKPDAGGGWEEVSDFKPDAGVGLEEVSDFRVFDQGTDGACTVQSVKYQRWDDDMQRMKQPNPAYSTSSASVPMFVKNLDGSTSLYYVDLDWTVCHFKLLIAMHAGICIDDQRLMFSGMQLEGCRSLDSYRIQERSTLHMVLRVRGC